MMTAADALTRLVDFVGGDQANDRNLRMARNALADTLANFPVEHDWQYYRVQARVNLAAPYSTGTVQYVASTRQLTLTGGTWPTWAAGALVIVGEVAARVESRTSGTVLVLSAALTFAADLAAGTSYFLVMDRYPLPDDFLCLKMGKPEGVWAGMCYVNPQVMFAGERAWGSLNLGTPHYYTVLPQKTVGSRQAWYLAFQPYADLDQTLDYVYQRRVRPVVYDQGVIQGTVTVGSGSTALTGLGTALAADMAGSVIRLSADATSPELGGQKRFETFLASVADQATAVLAEAAPQAFTGVGYQVSDPIDADESMATALLWQAIRTLAAETNHKALPKAEATFQTWLSRAKDADEKYAGPRVAGPGYAIPGRVIRTGPDD